MKNINLIIDDVTSCHCHKSPCIIIIIYNAQNIIYFVFLSKSNTKNTLLKSLG